MAGSAACLAVYVWHCTLCEMHRNLRQRLIPRATCNFSMLDSLENMGSPAVTVANMLFSVLLRDANAAATRINGTDAEVTIQHTATAFGPALKPN